MTTIALAPPEYVLSPAGIMHIADQHPAAIETLCGTKRGRGWQSAEASMRKDAATCLPCRIAAAKQSRNLEAGNYAADNGVDQCHCGGMEWENDTCIYCGDPHPSLT